MNINKLIVLIKVLEFGSLTKAAEKLGYTQSGVSHVINSLEEEFGFPIVTRNRSGVKLTKNGSQVIGTVREILKLYEYLDQEIHSIKGIEKGTIHIAVFRSVLINWIPKVIKSFKEEFPKISVNLVDGDYLEIEKWISEGEVDFGFVSLPTSYLFETRPLYQDPMYIVLPSNHQLKDQQTLRLEDIKDDPFIMPLKGVDVDIKRIFSEASLVPNVKVTTRDDYAIVAMVEMGLGISILPELVLMENERSVLIKEIEKPVFRTIGIAMNSRSHLSPAAAKCMSYIETILRNVK